MTVPTHIDHTVVCDHCGIIGQFTSGELILAQKVQEQHHCPDPGAELEAAVTTFVNHFFSSHNRYDEWMSSLIKARDLYRSRGGLIR